jgi:hypothetical protein
VWSTSSGAPTSATKTRKGLGLVCEQDYLTACRQVRGARPPGMSRLRGAGIKGRCECLYVKGDTHGNMRGAAE